MARSRKHVSPVEISRKRKMKEGVAVTRKEEIDIRWVRNTKPDHIWFMNITGVTKLVLRFGQVQY